MSSRVPKDTRKAIRFLQGHRQPRDSATATHQAKSCVDAGLHIDVHGSLGVQQPGSHSHQRAQHIRRGLSNHQNLARGVQPVQLQMRAWKEHIDQIQPTDSAGATVSG